MHPSIKFVDSTYFPLGVSFFAAPTISVHVITNGAPELGQSHYALMCNINNNIIIPENLRSSVIYKWTKSNGTQTQMQVEMGDDPKMLSFPQLRLSNAGRYTCQVTLNSSYLNSVITAVDSHDLRIQSR